MRPVSLRSSEIWGQRYRWTNAGSALLRKVRPRLDLTPDGSPLVKWAGGGTLDDSRSPWGPLRTSIWTQEFGDLTWASKWFRAKFVGGRTTWLYAANEVPGSFSV